MKGLMRDFREHPGMIAKKLRELADLIEKGKAQCEMHIQVSEPDLRAEYPWNDDRFTPTRVALMTEVDYEIIVTTNDVVYEDDPFLMARMKRDRQV